MKLNSLILMVSLLAFSSCRKEETYQVDSTLDPYLQMFLQEASQRGLRLDVEKNGLLMKFSDLEPPTIGLCTYTDPLLVEIDRTYWNEVKRYRNCEDLRQNVVFHELAHGLLNRRHDNAYLANSEWKSIMCGGDEVEGRSWAVNFTGYRKAYYLNELFNIRQEEPEWATLSVPVPDGQDLGDTISSLDLTKEYHKVDNTGITYDLRNGVYTITLNMDHNIITNMYAGAITTDFLYEVVLKSSLMGNGDCVGIGAGYKDSRDSLNYNLFYVTKNKVYDQYRVYAINHQCLPPLAEVLLDKSDCELREFTKLSVARRKGEYFFYVNDKLVYRHDYDADRKVTRLAVVAPSQGSVAIRSAVCRSIGTSATASYRSANMMSDEVVTPVYVALPAVNYQR